MDRIHRIGKGKPFSIAASDTEDSVGNHVFHRPASTCHRKTTGYREQHREQDHRTRRQESKHGFERSC